MSLQWVPTIVYNGVTIAFTIPMHPWMRRQRHVGKGKKVSSGARESFTIRNDRYRAFRLRMTEAEFHALEAFYVWALGNWGSPFDFTLTTGVTHSCYLESPQPGDTIAQEPSDLPNLIENTLVLEKANGTAWTEVFF